jgi:hypothetical protein
VKYELGFYIPKDGNVYSQRRETLKSYVTLMFVEEAISVHTQSTFAFPALPIELIYSPLS